MATLIYVRRMCQRYNGGALAWLSPMCETRPECLQIWPAWLCVAACPGWWTIGCAPILLVVFVVCQHLLVASIGTWLIVCALRGLSLWLSVPAALLITLAAGLLTNTEPVDADGACGFSRLGRTTLPPGCIGAVRDVLLADDLYAVRPKSARSSCTG